MVEVRATVKLTNAFDEERAAEGELALDDVRRFDGDALIDTGAVRSTLPLPVVQALGVRIRGQAVAEYAGRLETVGLTAPITFELLGRSTTDEALVLGNEILIGQTILEKLDLLPDCARRRLIPNPEHPYQPVSKVK